MDINSSRPIIIFDFFAITYESVVKKSSQNSDQYKLLTEERIKTYVVDFLKSNHIPLAEDCRTLSKEEIDSLTEDSFKDLYYKTFGEGDSSDFKQALIDELNKLLDIINNYDNNKQINEDGFESLIKRIVLRLLYDIYRKIAEVIDNYDLTKSYIYGIKMLNTLRVPANFEEYSGLYQQFHILGLIEKSIEKINIPEFIPKMDINKYLIKFPSIYDLNQEIQEVISQSFPIPEAEKKLLEIKSKYFVYDIAAAFANPMHISEIVNLICPSETYKENFKTLITEYQKDISTKKRIFEDFFEEKIEDLRAKKLNFGENILPILSFIINSLDEKKKDEDVIKQIGLVFSIMYKKVVQDYRIETESKMDQLEELKKYKENFCNPTLYNEFKKQYHELSTQKIDYNKVFFENHYEKKPLNYLFIIYLAYKLDDLNFIQKVLKSYFENRLLRNYARDLIYRKLEDYKNTTSIKNIDKLKNIYREYFTAISNDKERVEYKKEVLKYLVNVITQKKQPPYDQFYSEMADVFLAEINKILDVTLINRKATGKVLKSNEEKNLQVILYLINENLYNKLVGKLDENDTAKEQISRKIDLRFTNEYKRLEERYSKYSKKLSML